MRDAYDKMLQRLRTYRTCQNLSQKSMSSLMGITQSHYSKLETGKKIISWEELSRLSKCGWDVDYIVTGEISFTSVLDGFMEACYEECKAELLQFMVWTVHQGIKIEGKTDIEMKTYEREIEFLRYRESCHSPDKTVWYKVRKSNDMTQNEMADVLDVNVKRYREIEKGKTTANAEMLTSLYEGLGYPPSLIFEENVSNLGSLNRIWNEFGEALQRELTDYIEKGYELCTRWKR